VIAPSFADIFFNNCFKNGLLPIVLPEAVVAQLFDEVAAFPGYELTVDLERQVVVRPQGQEIPFDVQAFRKYCLLNGLDDIGLTLRHADKIKAFEAERLATKPWLAKCTILTKYFTRQHPTSIASFMNFQLKEALLYFASESIVMSCTIKCDAYGQIKANMF
jgi:hypothetical protein